MGFHTPSQGRYGVWQEAQMVRRKLSGAKLEELTGVPAPFWSKWRTGRELPTEDRREVIAKAFEVDPTTVPIPTDTERADLARYLAGGNLPSSADSGIRVSFPDPRDESNAGGQQLDKERTAMEYRRRAAGFMDNLPNDAWKDAALDALDDWKDIHKPRSGTLPQPAARRALSRKKR